MFKNILVLTPFHAVGVANEIAVQTGMTKDATGGGMALAKASIPIYRALGRTRRAEAHAQTLDLMNETLAKLARKAGLDAAPQFTLEKAS